MQEIVQRRCGMAKCSKDCLNCPLKRCKYDLKDEKELFRDTSPNPVKEKKGKSREIVVNHKRGRPKKEREIPYWDEWYAKNKERCKARSKARYQLKKDEIKEKNREWRRNHKDYYKEWYRKRKEKEHDNNRESESLIG